MARVFLLLGGNREDRLEMLRVTKSKIRETMGGVEQESSVYETEPWGFKDDTYFLNQLVQVETHLSAEAVLKEALIIEESLNRERSTGGYTGRTMDIDILFYDNLIVEQENLTIPHPRLHLRRFALEPLNEIAQNMKHPVLGKSMSQLLNECEDEQSVTIYSTN